MARPVTPVQEETARTKRFSMLKFRHASDSQLAARARLQRDAPPVPKPPEIITTAPTFEMRLNPSRDTLKAPAYGDETLGLPNRLSESASDGSSNGVYATTTTTTTTTFFRLPRRKRHLFPMPDRPRPSSSSTQLDDSPRPSLAGRGRAGTVSSLRSEEPNLRTSSSTGRKSFGDLFGLARLRQNSESVPPTPKSTTLSVSMPERLDDESPANYLVRLEEAVSRGVVASVLSKSTDPFTQAVLRSYMRGFGFFGDPMDMAIRKLLMEVELPKETQQIDRCLQAFANRYHECNPGVYENPDQAYFIAFSLLILHTDVFNKNNKNKMQKADYLRNTKGEGIFDDILECFYDNISYTPFIHVEDDLDINGERIVPGAKKRSFLGDPIKRPREPIDPYTLIIDGKLDTLRPNLKEVMYLEEQYSYGGGKLNMQELQNTFFKTGILQIVSARSRPDAFMSEKTLTNPEEAHPGIVDIKITKVGLLWRKDAKKKKTRSPWQEWGAILTGAQLYFFRNTTWTKSLMHQLDTKERPVTFRPPLENFKPDALMSTDNAVALLDATYKKHKNAFVFVRHGGFEETLLADNEDERNDWLAKLNYAAAFRTAGVRMRGVVGAHYDGQRSRGMRHLGPTQSVQTLTGEVTIASSKIDAKLAQDILYARRDIMKQRIAQMDDKLAIAEKQLETQLRNARHLQILAPIQVRTREQVLSSAAKMSAKLKWMRMEMWRLRCHRDILRLDMEEEAREEAPESPALKPEIEVFHTPPLSSSFHKQSPWELPPLDFKRSSSVESRPKSDRPDTRSTESAEPEKKIRRSLHRSLRDGHMPSRSRRPAEEVAENQLSRGTGSFVVHGKKASVITFGAEFQNMSQENRRRASAQKDRLEVRSSSPRASVDGPSMSESESEGDTLDVSDVPDEDVPETPLTQSQFFTPSSRSPVSE